MPALGAPGDTRLRTPDDVDVEEGGRERADFEALSLLDRERFSFDVFGLGFDCGRAGTYLYR